MLEEALRYAAGDVLPQAMKKELAQRDLIRAEIKGRMVCTSEEAHAEEQDVGKCIWSGRGVCAPLLSGKAYLPEQQVGGVKLDREQTEAIGAVLASRDRIMAPSENPAPARAPPWWDSTRSSRHAAGGSWPFAPTASASRKNLVAKGFADATTLQALITSPTLQEACRGNVILCDEVTQAGVLALLPVFRLAERHQAEGYDTRVLVVGDPLQHRGVARGEFFTIAREQAGLEPVARLNTIRRQKDNPEYLRAVELLSEGKTGEAFDLLDKLGFIHEIPDAEERYRHMARDYADGLKAGTSEMIVSPTHAEGRAVMAAVRQELRRRELLSGDDREFVPLRKQGYEHRPAQGCVAL